MAMKSEASQHPRKLFPYRGRLRPFSLTSEPHIRHWMTGSDLIQDLFLFSYPGKLKSYFGDAADLTTVLFSARDITEYGGCNFLLHALGGFYVYNGRGTRYGDCLYKIEKPNKLQNILEGLRSGGISLVLRSVGDNLGNWGKWFTLKEVRVQEEEE